MGIQYPNVWVSLTGFPFKSYKKPHLGLANDRQSISELQYVDSIDSSGSSYGTSLDSSSMTVSHEW